MRELKAAGVSSDIIVGQNGCSREGIRNRSTDTERLPVAAQGFGIYYYTGGKLVEFLPTNASNSQTRAAGAVFGSALIPVKTVAQLTGACRRPSNAFNAVLLLQRKAITGIACDVNGFSYYAFSLSRLPARESSS